MKSWEGNLRKAGNFIQRKHTSRPRKVHIRGGNDSTTVQKELYTNEQLKERLSKLEEHNLTLLKRVGLAQ